MGNINILAILAAAVVPMFIGALWYSPVLFGNEWMKEMGMDPADKKLQESMKSKAGKGYTAMFVGNIFMAIILYMLLVELSITEMTQALMWGSLLSFAFHGASALGSIFWEDHSVKLFLINSFYSLVSVSAIAITLSVFL